MLPNSVQLNIQKSIFTKTGSYNDMTLRSYQSNFGSQADINMFRDMTSGGTNFSSANIGSMATNFISPSTAPTHHANIDNGWGIERYRFIIMVDHTDHMGGIKTTKVVQGYTDYCGTANNTVDHNMRLYFNNVITLRKSQIGNPQVGFRDTVAVASADHILRGDYDAGRMVTQTEGQSQTMTPSDVFNTMAVNLTMGGFDSMGGEVYNALPYFSMSPIKKSKRSNNNPSRYLSDILTTYKNVVQVSNDAEHIIPDTNQVFDAAAGMAKEQPIAYDPFLALMINESQGFNDYGSVTYGEMCAIIPGFDEATTFIAEPQVFRTNTGSVLENHVVGQTEHWTGSGLDTIWATALVNSVPSLMMDGMITAVGFHATNKRAHTDADGYAGQTAVKITHLRSFIDDHDVSGYAETFKARLIAEILNGLTRLDTIEYEMTVHVNFWGETRISLIIQDLPYVEFATPTFADGTFSPVITNSSENLHNIANSLQSLVSDLHIQPNDGFDTIGSGLNTNWNHY